MNVFFWKDASCFCQFSRTKAQSSGQKMATKNTNSLWLVGSGGGEEWRSDSPSFQMLLTKSKRNEWKWQLQRDINQDSIQRDRLGRDKATSGHNERSRLRHRGLKMKQPFIPAAKWLQYGSFLLSFIHCSLSNHWVNKKDNSAPLMKCPCTFCSFLFFLSRLVPVSAQ